MSTAEKWWYDGQVVGLMVMEQHGLVPTFDIEAFEYESPYDVGDPMPCDNCRGQGVVLRKRSGPPEDQSYYLLDCTKCKGATEITFLCEECGALGKLRLDDGSEVIYHAAGCKKQEYCYERISNTMRLCRKKVVERFDTRANGKPIGYCGVHAKQAKEREQVAIINKEANELSAWRYAEREKIEATIDERVAIVARAIGYEKHPDHRIQANGDVMVVLPLPMLETVLGITKDDEEKALPIAFEEDDTPDPL